MHLIQDNTKQKKTTKEIRKQVIQIISQNSLKYNLQEKLKPCKDILDEIFIVQINKDSFTMFSK
jgi:ATP-dependent Lon protease